MKWCCDIFQGWFQEAGKRGISVFGSSSEGAEVGFVIQFRALDEGQKAPKTEFPLSIVSEVCIQFCPWCGTNLSKFYRKHFSELDKSTLSVKV